MRYQLGFPESARPAAVELYDEAFAAKLRPAIPDDAARLAVLTGELEPAKSVAALDGDELLGLAGFHDRGGSLTGGITLQALRREVGWARALRACC